MLASSAAAHSYTPCIVAVRLVMMAPHEDQGFESMLAQLDARGCRVTRAERQSSASHPRQPLVNAEEVGASPWRQTMSALHPAWTRVNAGVFFAMNERASRPFGTHFWAKKSSLRAAQAQKNRLRRLNHHVILLRGRRRRVRPRRRGPGAIEGASRRGPENLRPFPDAPPCRSLKGRADPLL